MQMKSDEENETDRITERYIHGKTHGRSYLE